MKYRVYQCQKCHCHYYPNRSDQLYCSKKCRLQAYAEMRRALAAENKTKKKGL